MTSDTFGKLLLMAVLILFSAYFSATETAFSALSRTRLKAMADKGNRRAALVLDLSAKYDNLLSTILVGNNIVNIAVASIGTILFVRRFGEELGTPLSTAVVTVVVLLCGEVTPKSLAKEAPERVAMASAPVLRVLMIVLTPVNWLFFQWKKLLARLFRVNEDRRLTQEELLLVVDEVERDGGIDDQERELVRNAIDFNDLQAEDVLTPRVSVEGIDVAADRVAVRKAFVSSGYTRLPVYDGTIDHIVGIVHQKDFYDPDNQGVGIRELMKPAIQVAPNLPIGDLLRQLQRTKNHMAVVADEHGGTMGIVTMEDILEELVGEIWDEHDEVKEPIRRMGDGRYLVDGDVSPEKLFDIFQLQEETECSTLSGWMMEELGHIPAVGDQITRDGITFTVQKTELNRATEIVAAE